MSNFLYFHVFYSCSKNQCVMCMSNFCFLVSASAGSSLQKRVREEELESTTEVTESTQDDLNEPPMAKKIRFIQRVGLEVHFIGQKMLYLSLFVYRLPMHYAHTYRFTRYMVYMFREFIDRNSRNKI